VKGGEKVTRFTYDEEIKGSVNLIAKRDYRIAMGENDNIVTGVEYRALKVPAKKGSVGAYLNVFCNGELIDKIELVTAKEVKKLTLIEKLMKKFSYL